MKNANKSPKMPYSAIEGSGQVIWNVYPGPDRHQQLIDSINQSISQSIRKELE